MKIKPRSIVGIALWLLILIVFVAVNVVVITFYDFMTAALVGTFSDATDEEIRSSLEAGTELADAIAGEGIVLLQNEGDVLPLSGEVKKVNVFGWSSTQWVHGGSGSGRNVKMDTDFLTALDNYGVSHNAELTKMYRDFRSDRPFYDNRTGTLNSHNYEFSRLYEPSVYDKNYYSDGLIANAKNYSDTAIVAIGRVSGESNDSPRAQHKQVTKNGEIVRDDTRTYLEISSEEEELLKFVGKNFADVIVLVNSTNTMELGFLETIEGLDACLLVGCSGENAATAIPKVLYGDYNPSGKTTDTYAYEFESNASYANAGMEGEGAYTNSEGLYPCGTRNANVGSSDVVYESVYYTDYVEGIYVGYKWYETAYAEGYWNDVSNKYGTGYKGTVQYPFGYGQSYTKFKWEFASDSASGRVLAEGDTVTIGVKVTNIGKKAGKDVVQLYYTAPYYDGGLEKSYVELCGFGKTKTLAPGESDTIDFSVSVYELASYDCYDVTGNGFTGYEVEAGDYEFRVMRNAHDQALASVVYNVAETITFANDPDTTKAIKNRFTGADAEDGVSLDGSDSNAGIKFLTRSNFKDTFPHKKAPDREMTDNVIALNLYTEENAKAWEDENAAPIVTGQKNGMVVYDNGITELGMKLGGDYDDPLWEKLMDQFTFEEMERLFYHYYLSPEPGVPSIGKYKVFEADGPGQIGSFNTARHGTGFPNPTVIAQTWNPGLATAFGRQVGLEATNLGFDGWYAPGINLHRSPLGGRNYEYYSEDDYMSGIFCSNVVNGAMDRGVYCYIKHLIAYDQDAYRDSQYIWMTEQTLRETYLKPFERAVKDGATGIMTSYNRIGAVWTGGSSALQMSVLRGEWGFKGALLTDYSDHQEFINSDHNLRAGGDQILFGFGSDVTFKYDKSGNGFAQAIRRSAKNSTYIWLNALYRNKISGLPERALRVPGGGWITPVFIVFDIAVLGLMAFWLIKIIRKIRMRSKN